MLTSTRSSTLPRFGSAPVTYAAESLPLPNVKPIGLSRYTCVTDRAGTQTSIGNGRGWAVGLSQLQKCSANEMFNACLQHADVLSLDGEQRTS